MHCGIYNLGLSKGDHNDAVELLMRYVTVRRGSTVDHSSLQRLSWEEILLLVQYCSSPLFGIASQCVLDLVVSLFFLKKRSEHISSTGWDTGDFNDLSQATFVLDDMSQRRSRTYQHVSTICHNYI